MTCPIQKFQQSITRDGRGFYIHQRVVIKLWACQKRLVEHNRNTLLDIIYDTERTHGTWLDPQDFKKKLRRAEGYLTARSQDLVNGLEIDASIFFENDKKQPTLPVLQKQILGVCSLNCTPMRFGIFNGQ